MVLKQHKKQNGWLTVQPVAVLPIYLNTVAKIQRSNGMNAPYGISVCFSFKEQSPFFKKNCFLNNNFKEICHLAAVQKHKSKTNWPC